MQRFGLFPCITSESTFGQDVRIVISMEVGLPTATIELLVMVVTQYSL